MLCARAACVLLVNNIKVLKFSSYLKVEISPSKRWQNLSGSMRGVLVLDSRQPRPKNCSLTALNGHTRAPSYCSHSTWPGPAKIVPYVSCNIAMCTWYRQFTQFCYYLEIPNVNNVLLPALSESSLIPRILEQKENQAVPALDQIGHRCWFFRHPT